MKAPDGTFYGVISPGWESAFLLTPKQLWKDQSHKKRYEQRYGRSEPGPQITEGRFLGMRFIEDEEETK